MKHAPKKQTDFQDMPPDLSERELDALLRNPEFRRMIDERLAKAEAIGGETSSDEVFAELRKRHGV